MLEVTLASLLVQLTQLCAIAMIRHTYTLPVDGACSSFPANHLTVVYVYLFRIGSLVRCIVC